MAEHCFAAHPFSSKMVRLGRFVSDRDAPHLAFIDPILDERVGIEVHHIPVIPSPAVLAHEDPTISFSIQSYIDTIYHGCSTIPQAQATIHEIGDSGAYLENAWDQPQVRRWLKSWLMGNPVMRNIYLVVGICSAPVSIRRGSSWYSQLKTRIFTETARLVEPITVTAIPIAVSYCNIAVYKSAKEITHNSTHGYSRVFGCTTISPNRDWVSFPMNSVLKLGYMIVSRGDALQSVEGNLIDTSGVRGPHGEQHISSKTNGTAQTISENKGADTTDQYRECSRLSKRTSGHTPQLALLYRVDTAFYDNYVVHHRQTPPSARPGIACPKSEVWRRVRILGEGGQGAVFLEESDAAPKLRAVKRVQRRALKANAVEIERELYALIAVSEYQDLFVEFLCWYEDDAKEYIYLAMEYVVHGDLAQYLKATGPTPNQIAQAITKQLLTAIAILHEKGICHRDLKPQNVLIASLSPIKVKLADFGVSKCTIETDLRTRYGTWHYMAPELQELLPPVLRRRGSLEYTNAVDLWALGIMVYEILSLSNPFQISLPEKLPAGYTESEPSGISAMSGPLPIDTYILSEFCKGNAQLPTKQLQNCHVTENGVKFITRLLVADPAARMSAADGLYHEWLVSN